MEQPTISSKFKFKIELQTFITIVVFMFGLWISWATIINWQKNIENTQWTILAKIDELSVEQSKDINEQVSEHKVIDNKLAFVDNRITPTLTTLAKRAWLQ